MSEKFGLANNYTNQYFDTKSQQQNHVRQDSKEQLDNVRVVLSK